MVVLCFVILLSHHFKDNEGLTSLLLSVAERMADIKTGGLVGGAVSGVIDSTISAVQGVKDPIYTFIGKKIKLPRPFRNQILLSM